MDPTPKAISAGAKSFSSEGPNLTSWLSKERSIVTGLRLISLEASTPMVGTLSSIPGTSRSPPTSTSNSSEVRPISTGSILSPILTLSRPTSVSSGSVRSTTTLERGTPKSRKLNSEETLRESRSVCRKISWSPCGGGGGSGISLIALTPLVRFLVTLRPRGSSILSTKVMGIALIYTPNSFTSPVFVKKNLGLGI